MNKLFTFISMFLLINSNAQQIKMANNTPDSIIETYKENYVQLSSPEDIFEYNDFKESVSKYENMEYRDYTYDLYRDEGNFEDASPYFFPFTDYLEKNNNGMYGLTYYTPSGNENYMAFVYNHYNENFHFYEYEENVIEFYLEVTNFFRTTHEIEKSTNPFKEMLDYYTSQLESDFVFEIPLVIIDGVDVAGLLINTLEDEQHYHFYSRVGDMKFVQKTQTNNRTYLNIKIPRVDTINSIDILSASHFSNSNLFELYDPTPSGVDTFIIADYLVDKHAPFLFEVADIDLLDKKVTFDHFVGNGYNDSLYIEEETVNDFIAESIKLKFNASTKQKIGSTIQTKKTTIERTLNLSFKEEVNGTYVYDITTSLPELQSAGSLEVLEVTYEVKTDSYTSNSDYKHIYENKMEHPTFSYEATSAIRQYYYDLNQYGLKAANIFNNWDEIFTGVQTVLTLGLSQIPTFKGWFYKHNLANNIINNYYMVQAFGFDFYFDENKTKPIPNVKSVTTKYQYGANYTKTYDTSEAYLAKYPIKVKTMTSTAFGDSNLLGNYKIDESKGVIMFDYTSENIPDEMRGLNTNNNKAYDYVIMNCYKIGDLSTCIRHMESLEITYVAKGYETVKLVSNSLGLHIVDGKVYGADGTYYPEYGVYVSDDGTQVVAKDENNDGKLTSDETINSDTGSFQGEPLPEEDKWTQNWNEFLDNLTKDDGVLDKAKTTILIILGVGLLVLVGYGTIKIVSLIKSNNNTPNKNKKRKGKKRK